MMIPMLLLGAAILVAVAAALRAKDLASIIVAVDVAVVGLVGLLAFDAVGRGAPTFLDALPVLGLLAVLATLAGAWVLRPDGNERTDEPILRGGGQ